MDKGTISSAFRSNQITSIESNRVIKNAINVDNNYPQNESSITVYTNTSTINNSSSMTGPNHLKIIPSSGVIIKNVGNSKMGNENYTNKNGRMTYKEFISLRKKYMGTEAETDVSIHNNEIYNVYPKNEEEKKQPVKIKDEEKISHYRSKSKHDKVRNYYLGDNQDSKVPEEPNDHNTIYNINYDENGKEVLNENLFKNRGIEYKTMRKTYTGKFLPIRGTQNKDVKGETMFNFNSKFNSNNGLNFNNNAYRSYYGNFRKNSKKK